MMDWSERSVFLTGHTGFKGTWLGLWLKEMGASLHGFSLDPPTHPALFHETASATLYDSDTRADINHFARLRKALEAAAPEVVFHLAAQPLVRASYADPLGTHQANVMGTAAVLEAVRCVPSVKAVVVVTTDKVYRNLERPEPYAEEDPLGGHDPYSASKAAAEIVVASMRDSFFSESGQARVASARAGNVIGGGDWAADRLVPDCLRAFAAGKPVRLRYPRAVRPWQHVLEPLSGYLRLAGCLLGEDGDECARAWNFGPEPAGHAEVGGVAEQMAGFWGDGAQVEMEPGGDFPHEAGLLKLDISASREGLAWRPRWDLPTALRMTVDWHRRWTSGASAADLCREQIRIYREAGEMA